LVPLHISSYFGGGGDVANWDCYKIQLLYLYSAHCIIIIILCCPLVSPIASHPTLGSVVPRQGGCGVRYGHSGCGGGPGVTRGVGKGSAVSNLNSSYDDSGNDDPDYKDTRVDGDVNGDDYNDFDIINEGSPGDNVVLVA
jgi:hypothetical protein